MDNNRIMKIDYEWTDGSNEDFHKFYLKTEKFYSSIVGGLKNRTAFVFRITFQRVYRMF